MGGKKTEHQIHMGQYCKSDYRKLKYQKEKKEEEINIKIEWLKSHSKVIKNKGKDKLLKSTLEKYKDE